ncbi:MAG: DNA polymerase III subunit gamma/tau [Planctomycetota bacterium]
MNRPDSTAAGTATGTEYQVIARRYRPRFFSEVVGQEATAEALRQAIVQKRLAHAYLFCGPRGVGKTSMARIFARALQCPNAKDGNPCDECPTCERIFRGEDLDVAELDGASHRGIDDMRDLIQHVRYTPNAGPYRIFIVDEVHMLTREAFNALLKTLEEPPAHVKFIFATTEPDKILPTVLSRCQRCDFSPISTADIVRRLEQVCAAEGAVPEEGLLPRVAELARGGMRDSQSLLDQLLSFAGSEPRQEDLDRITGRIAPSQVQALVDRLERGERADVVRDLMVIEQGGTDPSILLEQIVEEFRTRLHRGVSEDWDSVACDRNLLAQEILQEARMRVKQLTRSDVTVELALLRIATLASLVPVDRWLELPSGRGEPPTSSARAVRNRSAAAMPPSERDTAGPAARPSAEGAAADPRTQATPRAPAATQRLDTGTRTPLERIRAALESAAPTVARMVGERIQYDAGAKEIVLRLDAAAARLVEGKRLDDCRQEVRKELGADIRIRVEVEASPGEHASPQATSADGPASTPEIVAKAKEIFRGTVQRAARPPRSED